MNEIFRNSITERENNILPFLKIQLKDTQTESMDFSIRKSKNIIKKETFKLVDEFKILKYNNNPRNSILKPNNIFNTNLHKKKISKLIINNNLSTSENNSYLKNKFQSQKNSSENNSIKYKKIKNVKLSSDTNKYLSLLSKYRYNYISKKGKLEEDSKINNNYISLLTKPNKSSSYILTNETKINNSNNITKSLTNNKIKITKNYFNKSHSKFYSLEKELYDTQKSSMNIIKRIKKYKIISKRESQNITDKLQRNEESIKKIDNLIDQENSKKNRITNIDYNKILGPLNKLDDNMQRIKINRKTNGLIWLKKSTANLIKFGQYFNRMDDDQFFKQRKKIINKFAALEKDSDIIDGIKTERIKYNNLGMGIKINNKIIKQLAEDNFDFYTNVTKKFDKL